MRIGGGILTTSLVAACAAAHAGNGIATVAVALYPTFENMGVEVRCQGDDNLNAVGDVFYRARGETAWKHGHPLVLVGDTPVDPKTGSTTNPRFYSSIFCLNEDTAYEVKVEVKDPVGVTAPPAVVTAKTRNSQVPNGSGKHCYVSALLQVPLATAARRSHSTPWRPYSRAPAPATPST